MTISLANGDIVGIKEKNGLTKYLGIPYAHIPARFERALDAAPWEGVKSCTKSFNYPQNTKIAARIPTLLPVINNPPFAYSSENDLLLDVHIPKTEKSQKLAVMVYIHGGSYQVGGPVDYPGNDEFVTRGGVILVVIQYRLGLAGFFSWNNDNG